MALGLICLVSVNVFLLLRPYLFSQIIDSIVSDGETKTPFSFFSTSMLYALFLCLLSLAIFFLRLGWRRLLILPSHKIETNLKKHLFRHFLRFCQKTQQNFNTGKQVSLIERETLQLTRAISWGTLALVDGLFTVISVYCILIFFYSEIAWASLLVYPFSLLYVYIIFRKLGKEYVTIQERISKISELTREMFENIPSIKSHNSEAFYQQKFQQKGQDIVKSQVRISFLTSMLWPLLILINGIALVLVLYFGIKAYMAGTASIGDIFAVLTYIAQVELPFLGLGFAFDTQQRGMSNVRRIKHSLEIQPSVFNKKTGAAVPGGAVAEAAVPGGAVAAVPTGTTDASVPTTPAVAPALAEASTALAAAGVASEATTPTAPAVPAEAAVLSGTAPATPTAPAVPAEAAVLSGTAPATPTAPALAGALSLKNLVFSYDELQTEDHDIHIASQSTVVSTPPPSAKQETTVQEKQFSLGPIDLDIAAGTWLGITGKIGSGKSTLAKLITRIYEIKDAASILWDKKSIQDIDLEQLRSNILYQAQDFHLFSISVLQNIAFKENTLTQQERERAKRYGNYSALEQDIHTLPERWDTQIGEHGILLSGGQKQRVSLARTLFETTPILVLDDVFSGLDNKTSKEILRSLLDLRKNKTTIIVSLNLPIISNTDRILVLDEGKIIEEGTHNDLLNKTDSKYSLYWKEYLVNQGEYYE